MANTALDPYKYNTRTAIDGSPLKPGEVLVPFWLQEGYKLSAEARKNCTTFHIGGFKFHIGFMPIKLEGFATYMEGFNKEINTYVAERREGRCVIGCKPNGEPICCPKSHMCTGCENRYRQDIKRYNPLKDRYDILSLDYCYKDEEFDVADENATSPEEAYIASEEMSEDELYILAIAHFEKVNPRYATIYKLSREKVSIEEICTTIGLKPSRGREEINNAYNALCDFLDLGCYKLKKKR